MKILLGLFLLLAAFGQSARAGWIDSLNQASQKLNQYSQQVEQRSQQMQQAQSTAKAANHDLTPTTNPIKGTWGTQVTCAGPNTATCQNGMDDLVNCMNQTRGYYYRLVADVLEKKLKSANPSGQARKDFEADLAAVKAAVNTGQVVDPDPQNQQRWLGRLTNTDQQQINQLNSKYMNEVRTDCDNRFGGMSRYSNR